MDFDKKLIMISLDAVSTDDLVLLSTLPNFKSLLDRGSLVKNVDSVFISNTYPAHTSIITGVHPNKHGICENLDFTPTLGAPIWQYSSNLIKSPTLYDKVFTAGGVSAGILYPVTFGAKIKYNLPEIAGEMTGFQRIKTILKGGNAGFILSKALKFRKYFKGTDQPALDDFMTKVACDVILGKKPNLTLLHLIDVDHHKHIFGPTSKQAVDALVRHDGRLGEILSAIDSSDNPQNFQLIIFSDHGCLPVHSTIDPNAFLKQYGYINISADLQVQYDAFFHNAGGTTFLKIYNENKRIEIMTALKEFINSTGIDRLLTEQEMKISGMDAHFDTGIEAKIGFSFGEAYKGQHGYTLDHPSYKPFYLAVGDVPEGRVYDGGCIVDICPLAADMLGLDRWEVDGVNYIKKSEKSLHD